MPQFEPCNKFFPDYCSNTIWRKDRFDAFTEDFCCESAFWATSAFVTNSASYFTRFMYEVGRIPRKRRMEYSRSGDQFNKYWRLFDHATAFKTKKGVHIIISMPYGTPEQIIDEYTALKKEYRSLAPIDMYFIDNRYKYRKNGDHMLMFVWWPLGMMESFPRSMMSRTIACDPDEWSNQ